MQAAVRSSKRLLVHLGIVTYLRQRSTVNSDSEVTQHTEMRMVEESRHNPKCLTVKKVNRRKRHCPPFFSGSE